MKQKINVWDYAGKIAEAMKPGILVTTKAEGKVNTFRRLTLPGKSQSVCAYKMHVYYIICILYTVYVMLHT